MGNKVTPLNRARILKSLFEAEKATLEAVAQEIETRARAKAPVRKLYHEGGKRRKGPRASASTIQAAITFINNNKRITQRQRTEALYLLQRHPEEARTLTQRRSSMNRRRTVLLGKYKNVSLKQKSGLFKGQIVATERVFSGKGQMAKMKQRNLTQRGVKPQLGFEPTAKLDKNLNSRGRYELRSGRAFTNEAGELTTPGAQPNRVYYGGHLKASITQGAVGRPDRETRAEVQVSASAPYALYVEFPTRHNRAQPFLLPAMKEGAKSLERTLKYELQSRGLKRG